MEKVILIIMIILGIVIAAMGVFAQGYKIDLKKLKDNVSSSVNQLKNAESGFYHDNISDNYTFARDSDNFQASDELQAIAVDSDVKSTSFKGFDSSTTNRDAALEILAERANKTDNLTSLDNISRTVMSLPDNEDIAVKKAAAKDNLSDFNLTDNIGKVSKNMDNATALMQSLQTGYYQKDEDNGSVVEAAARIDVAGNIAGELSEALDSSDKDEFQELLDGFADYGEEDEIILKEKYYEIRVLGGDEKKCREQHTFLGMSKTNICGYSGGCWDDGYYLETNFCRGEIKVDEHYNCKETKRSYADYGSCAAECASICSTTTNYDDPELKWHGIDVTGLAQYTQEEKDIMVGKELGLCREVRSGKDSACLLGHYTLKCNFTGCKKQKVCDIKGTVRTNHYYCCYSDVTMMNLSYRVKNQLGYPVNTCEGIKLKDFVKADFNDPEIRQYMKSKGLINDDMLVDFKGKFQNSGETADDENAVAQKTEKFSDNYTNTFEEAKKQFNFAVPRI
jgi:hypothetical protein